jgi:alanine dehydrogenase
MMRIGVPKEIKVQEARVALTPEAAGELTAIGAQVLVQAGAGAAIGYSDDDYLEIGASILEGAEAVFEASDLIVKVKEPQLNECALLRPDQTLFTYLHLAADKVQAEALMKSGATCIAYETVTDDWGGLPLLRPMSEVAGRMSVQVGAHYLEKPNGGPGILLGGVPGVLPAKVVILGGGVAGVHAAEMAVGLRADVTIFDITARRLAELDLKFEGRARTAFASRSAVAAAVADADLVIGAVLVPGAAAPKLVTRAMLRTMRPGSVLVDVAIDQGGCFETSHATTHAEPVFEVDGITHYCVANMPGGVARTSAQALSNVTLPFIKLMAEHGVEEALRRSAHLRNGLNIAGGSVRHRAVAEALDLPCAA